MAIAEWQISVGMIPTAGFRNNHTAIPAFAQTICGLEWEDERAAPRYEFAAACYLAVPVEPQVIVLSPRQRRMGIAIVPSGD